MRDGTLTIWRFVSGAALTYSTRRLSSGSNWRLVVAGKRTDTLRGTRKERLEGDLGAFVRQYARKHYPGRDPNDRRYDLKIEQVISHMKPEELDELLRWGEDEDR